MAARLDMELAERIDRLESRFALRDLVSDYCHGFDRRDWPRFDAIWHEDAIWEIGPPFGTYQGRAAIGEAARMIASEVWRETHHLTSNLRVDFETADRARGLCNVDCMGATLDDVVQMISATYEDEFERRAGSWRIARRVVTIHYFNPIPGASMTPPAAAG